TGSMFIGVMLAATTLHASQKSSTAVAILIPMLALGLPIGDTFLAIVRRTLRGASPFRADKQHIHHRLIDIGLTHRQAVMALYAACAVLCASAFALTFVSSREAAALLAAVALLVVVLLVRLGYFSRDAFRRAVEERAEARQTLRRANEAGQR